MDVKGQVSVEYLLLILVVVIILGSVTIPLISNSISSSMDVSKTSDASQAVNSIANAVNIVYANGPGAKRTLSVYIPVTTALVFDDSNSANLLIKMAVTGVANSSKVPITDDNSATATKTVDASVPYEVTIITTPSSSPLTKGWHTVTVEWPVHDSTSTSSGIPTNTNPITVTFS